jgi:hypothetical protein
MGFNFEDSLKNSTHFVDVINTHRTATAQILVAFLGPLIKGNIISIDTVTSTLRQLEKGTGKPSVDGERRFAIDVIRESLQSFE